MRASFQREEGREVLFSLILTPPEKTNLLRFEHPIPLDTEHVRRLSQAVEPRHGFGVMFPEHNPGLGRLDRGPLIWGLTERRGDAVTIRGTSAGTVFVSFGGTNIAQFTGDRCTVIGCRTLDLLEGLGRLASDIEDCDFILMYLLQLANRIRSHGHGGSLVVLGPAPVAANEYEARYKIEQLKALSSRFIDSTQIYYRERRDAPDEIGDIEILSRAPDMEAFLEGDPALAHTDDLLGQVSQLALIDGAIVFDAKLSVLCAGAVLSRQPVESGTKHWNEWAPGHKHWRRRRADVASLGATRHQSAYNFVTRNRGSIALVCSHDGGVKLFGWPHSEPYPLIAREIEQVIA